MLRKKQCLWTWKIKFRSLYADKIYSTFDCVLELNVKSTVKAESDVVKFSSSPSLIFIDVSESFASSQSKKNFSCFLFSLFNVMMNLNHTSKHLFFLIQMRSKKIVVEILKTFDLTQL